MLYTVEAVVIRSVDYGEGHKIITLFTKEAGKVGVIARGAKKMRSRLAAMTQVFTYGEFTYYRSGQLGNLQSGDVIEAYPSLQTDIYKTAYAAYIIEMIDRMLHEHEGSAFLFEQLLAALQAIDEGKDPQTISHLFEMKMFDFAGYTPTLHACSNCASERISHCFSAQLGGVLCEKCRHMDVNLMRISARALHLLQTFQRVDLRQLGQVTLSAESKAELRRCMRLFIDTHVGGSWKSRQFIDQIDRFEMP